MKTPEVSPPRVKFKNPPINELVIGLYHLPLIELKAQHVGIYWQLIKDRFPLCEQQSPIGADFFAALQGELFPLPRFWFYRDPTSRLVQLQRNAFIYNWRRGGGEDAYPHYENVHEEFWSEFVIYQQFLRDTVSTQVGVIRSCELTYINIIPANGWSTPSELGAILPSVAGFRNVESEAHLLIGLNSIAAFRIDENLQVDVSVKTAARTGNKENVAILEIKGHGAPEGLSVEETAPWYDAAHEAIYELFLAFTDKEAQRKWEPLL